MDGFGISAAFRLGDDDPKIIAAPGTGSSEVYSHPRRDTSGFVPNEDRLNFDGRVNDCAPHSVKK